MNREITSPIGMVWYTQVFCSNTRSWNAI